MTSADIPPPPGEGVIFQYIDPGPGADNSPSPDLIQFHSIIKQISLAQIRNPAVRVILKIKNKNKK
jgi:hypothetical protein